MLSTTNLQLRSPEKLKTAIATAGLSTRRLAARTDLSPSRIAQLAAGEYPATSANSAVLLCSELGLDVAELFEFPDGEALIRLGLIRGF